MRRDMDKLKIRWGRQWPTIVLALYGISTIPAVLRGTWTAFEATYSFIALGAFFISVFVLLELRKQRVDSQKPLLVPHDLGTYIMPIHQKQAARGTDGDFVRKKGSHLCIGNIGSGPALNISIFVEEQAADKSEKACNTAIAHVPPLGQGDEDFVYHNSGRSKSRIVASNEWLIITYDDAFGNHFRTECQWSGEVWYNFRTQKVS